MLKTVLIADDHPIYLLGLRALLKSLSDTHIVVDEATTTDDLISKIDKYAPDIVITDMNMPGNKYNDGVSFIKLIKRRFPDIEVFTFGIFTNITVKQALIRIGVRALFDKASMYHDLVKSLSSVSGLNLPSEQCHIESSTVLASLTVKENEVLRLYLSGMKVNDISLKMNRTKQTVSAQKNSAMRKLGLNSECELYQFAHQFGLVH